MPSKACSAVSGPEITHYEESDQRVAAGPCEQINQQTRRRRASNERIGPAAPEVEGGAILLIFQYISMGKIWRPVPGFELVLPP